MKKYINYNKLKTIVMGFLLITIIFLPAIHITTGDPVSIDGWAVYASSGKVYRCAVGGSPEVLYSGDVAHACWSADGSFIYFIKTNGDIWVMNNDGTNQMELRTDTANTAKCPIGPYRPDTNYVLYVQGSSFYKISRVDGSKILIHTDTNGHSWDGEIAISTDGTRLAARDGDGLYKMTVGDGDSSVYYSVRCSSSISPNGNYLTKNWNGHQEMSIYTWDVYYPNTPYQHLYTPQGITWDNQKFVANSDDYVVYKIDSGATAIGLVRLSDETHWQIGNKNSDFPDFLLGPLPGTGDAPPTITSTAITSAHAGYLYSYDVHAAGNPPPTYTLTTAPIGMTIDSNNGMISWIPDSADIPTSPHDVTVTTTNTEGTDTQSYQVIVTESSSACTPGFNMVEGVSATGNSGTIQSVTVCGETYVIADDDLETGTTTRYMAGGSAVNPGAFYSEYADNFSLDNMTTLDSSTMATYLDTMFTAPSSTFIIFENGATSSGGHDPGDIQGLDISGNPVGSILSFTDADYYESGYETSMGRMAGVLSFTAELPVYGIRISNAEGIDPVSISSVAGSTTGQAPSIISSPITDINVGQPYQYDVEATGDPTITYELVLWPTEMTIDESTGIIQWLPDTPADFDVTVSATNNFGTDTQSFTITVAASSTTPCNPGLNMVEDVTATGDAGTIQSVTVCGNTYVTGDNDLLTGTTTRFASDDSPVNPGQYYSEYADNFSLADMTTLDSGTTASYLDTMFANPASTFIIFENGASGDNSHDAGDIQGLDISGNPVGSIVSFTDADYYQSIYETGLGRLAGVLSFTTESSVYGIRISNAVGMDPVSISAVYGITSGAAPIITTIPVSDANVGELYQYDVDAFGDPVLTFSLTTSPAGMIIESNTGMISWAPDSDDVATSPHNVLVSVANSYGSDSQSFQITVSGSSPSPCSPGLNMVEGVSATGNSGSIQSVTVCGETYIVSDNDLNTGTTTRYASDGGSVNPGQYYSEYADNFGLNNMTTLDSGTGVSYLDTMFTAPASTFIIFENGATSSGGHDSGDIQGLDDQGNPIGSVFSFTDADYYESGYETSMGRMAGVLSFTAESSVYGIRISNAVGMDPVSISAVTVSSSPSAPTIISTAITNAITAQQYTYDVQATGNPAPTYSLSISPTGMTIDSNNGMISWIPDTSDVTSSPHDVTLTATNTEGTDTQSYQITVYNQTYYSIMPLGDSITRGGGSTNDNGYRKTLYYNLTNNGYNFEFVGSLNDGDFSDNDHEGHGGKTAAWLNDRLNGPTAYFLQDNPPDIILYHIGTNNLGGSDIQQYANDANESLQIIYNFDSTIHVILAKIILTRDDADRNTRTHNYNLLLEDIAAYWQTHGYPITLVDMETGAGLNYDTSDMDDNLHPNDAGYAKMTPVWFNALTSLLSSDEPIITSTPPITATAGNLYSYNVQATGTPLPTFSLSISPAGMTIDTNTGLISWIPDGSDVSTSPHDVTVTAINTEGSDSQSYQIMVSDMTSCPDSLIHYWNLDETSTSPYNDSIGSADLTCSNCPTSTAGKVNNAQSFNAVNNQNFYSDPISNPTVEITLMAWVKPDAISSPDKGIITKENAFLLEIESDGAELSFSHYKSGTLNECEITTPVFTVGTWVHVAATWDGSIARVYVNGSEIGFEDFDDGLIDNHINPIYIGNSTYHANRFMDGTIDEVAIFDAALNQTEIEMLYLRGMNGQSLCNQGSPPLIISSPILTTPADQLYSYDVDATGNPAPTFILESAPAGMIIDSITGDIEWTPSTGQIGNHTITVNASNTNGWNLQTFTLEVTDNITLGDANGDGNVNAIDITYIELIIMGQRDPTPGADANEDGNVNAIDITKTEIIILGA